jgi:hypothetical protein
MTRPALKRLIVLLVTCAVGAIAAVAVASGSAAASATWSSVGTLTFKDTTSGFAMTCSGSTAAMVPANTGTNPFGHITSISFTGCTGPAGAITLTPKELSWPVNASPAARTVGETSGGHGVSVDVTTTGCSANVDGTGAHTGTGVVHFAFSHKSGALGVQLSGGNLHIYAVSGCGGVVSDGDTASLTVAYRIS